MSVQEHTRKVVTLLKKLNNSSNSHSTNTNATTSTTNSCGPSTQSIQKHCCDRLCDIYLSKSLSTRMQMTSSRNGLNAFLQANFPSQAARAHVIKWLSQLPSMKDVASDGNAPNARHRSDSIMSIESYDGGAPVHSGSACASFYTKYRRVTSNRMQASCTLLGIDFVWESRSIYHGHDWKLVRMALEDPEDEEMYWRPWQATIEEAEEEYIAHKSTVASPQDHHDTMSMGIEGLDLEFSNQDESLIRLNHDDQSKLRNLTIVLNRLASQQGFSEKPVVPASATKSLQVPILPSQNTCSARALAGQRGQYGRVIDHESDLFEDEYWNQYDEAYAD